MFVCCVCCVLSGRGLCDELITRPEKSVPVLYTYISPPQGLYIVYIYIYVCIYGNRDSVAGIANRYGLDGPGIEFIWWRDFLYQYKPALSSTQPPIL
jgi:hypothetical protein